MYRTICRLTLVLALFGLLTPTTHAGGVATVHLDAPPEKVVAGVPYRIGFMVMQHDITPVNLEDVVVTATHRETGDAYQVAAEQEGETGHYIAELVFPIAGSWKWMIIPAPFAGTSFESLMVYDSAASADDAVTGSAAHPAHIHFGSCGELGEVFFPLSDVVPDSLVQEGSLVSTSGKIGVETGAPVAISTSTIDVTIAELITGPHAINVHKSAEEIGTYVACGDLSGRLVNDELIIGLQPLNGSGDAGIAILREESGQTVVNVFLMAVTSDDAASGELSVTVEIIGSEGSWTFNPARVEITAGTTVVWVNKTETSHTVTGKDLAFEDSSPFGAGETYQQTFTEPGTYGYFCSPHPFMTGTVVVTE